MNKRILAFILAALLVFGCFGTALASGFAGRTREIISGYCGIDLTWQLDLDTGVLTVSGTGEMDYDYYPWENYTDLVYAIVIEEGVTTVISSAFVEFPNLTSVSLPSTIEEIGQASFAACESLTRIDIAPGSCYYSIDGVLFMTGDGSDELVAYPAGIAGDFTIPDFCSSVRECAFLGCAGLTAITFPSGLTEIGQYAFACCSGLTEIELPTGEFTLGNCAFARCNGITELTVPANAVSIGGGAFCECCSLESVTLEEGITEVSSGMFEGCTSLTSVTLPSTIETICWDAFEGSGIVTIVLPENVNTIEGYAFANCSELRAVIFEGYIPGSVGESIFENCNYDLTIYFTDPFSNFRYYLGNRWNDYPVEYLSPSGFRCGDDVYWHLDGYSKTIEIYGTGPMWDYSPDNMPPWYDLYDIVENVCVYNGVTRIGAFAFNSMYYLQSVAMGEGIAEIGEHAFAFCENIQYLSLPSTIKLVDEYAFACCSSITSVCFYGADNGYKDGSDGLVIGSEAFRDCTSLIDIEIGCDLASIGDFAFNGCNKLEHVRVYGCAPTDYVGEYVFGQPTSEYLIYCYPENASSWLPNGGNTWHDYLVWVIGGDNYEPLPDWVTVTCNEGGEIECVYSSSEDSLTINWEAYEGYTCTEICINGEVVAENPENPYVIYYLSGYRPFEEWNLNMNVIIEVVFAADEPPAPAGLGDADGSGTIDFDDVTLLNAYLLNAAELTEQGIENTDVNGDGRITSADVVALNKLILGNN